MGKRQTAISGKASATAASFSGTIGLGDGSPTVRQTRSTSGSVSPADVSALAKERAARNRLLAQEAAERRGLGSDEIVALDATLVAGPG
jgi:hypothetical protein